MVRLPRALEPSGHEIFALSSGRRLLIPKATPSFRRWSGAPPRDSYGGMQIIDFRGEAVFAELAILRALQADGWTGAWIDTYRRRILAGMGETIELPRRRRDHLNEIYARAGSRFGVAEAKRKGRDRIRKTQVRWVEAALAQGISPFQLLVVEWSVTDIADH